MTAAHAPHPGHPSMTQHRIAAGVRVLDVCSGYSASTLGWHGLGFQHVGYAEIDPFPRAILEQRHGAVPVDWDHRFTPGSNVTPLFGDFTKIEAHHVGPVDLLTGGTPCQAFSVAGKRLGLDDPRGNLTLEFLALARRLRVQWLAWENVPGILSHDGGRTMGTFLGLLGELGYGWAYRVLDAQYVRVDGCERAVPQRRRRVFVVGCLGDAARAAAVLFERESLRGDPAPRRQAGEGVAPTISARTKGGGGLGTDFDCDGGLVAGFGGGNRSGSIEAAACLTAKGQKCDFEVETFVMQAGVTCENPSSGPDGVGVQTGAAYCLEARAETQIVAHVAGTLPAGGNQTGGDRQPGMSQETADTMLVAHSLRADGFDASEDGTGRGTPLVPVCIHADAVERTGEAVNPSVDANGVSRLRDAGMGISEGSAFGLTTGKPHAVAFAQNSRDEVRMFGGDGATVGALGAEPGMKQQSYGAQPVAFSLRGRDGEPQAEPAEDGLSPSLRAVGGGSSHAFVAQQWAVRRLTPTECERLMGVPDGFTAITYRKKLAADGPRYKALGNSQAVNVMRWIGHGLADAIRATPPVAAGRPS